MYRPQEDQPRNAVQIASIVVVNMIYWMVLLAAIGFGALYLDECPVQPNIPVYLIVLGVTSITTLTLSYIKPTCSNGINVPLTNCCGTLLAIFIVCWFIAGTYWIYNVYPPSYLSGTDQYCHKTAYHFAFIITTLQWLVIALVLIYAVCFALLTCNIGASMRDHLILARGSFYGAASDYQPIVGGTP